MSDAPDFWSMLARKVLGVSEGWRWYRLEALDGGAGRRYSKITGATPDGVLFKSGPRKGKVNWKFKHEERELVVPFEEYEAFVAAWEKETGLCRDCGDTGKTFWKWSKDEGRSDRPCTRCARGGGQ